MSPAQAQLDAAHEYVRQEQERREAAELAARQERLAGERARLDAGEKLVLAEPDRVEAGSIVAMCEFLDRQWLCHDPASAESADLVGWIAGALREHFNASASEIRSLLVNQWGAKCDPARPAEQVLAQIAEPLRRWEEEDRQEALLERRRCDAEAAERSRLALDAEFGVITEAPRERGLDGVLVQEAATGKTMLRDGEGVVVGGGPKKNKTKFLLALGVGVASGTEFLPGYICPKAGPVAVLSGESGGGVLFETAVRIGRRIDVDADRLIRSGMLVLAAKLPRLDDPDAVARLARWIKARGIKLLAYDPLYLGLQDQGATALTNLLVMGPILRRFGDACLSAGATPVIAHHGVKHQEPGRPMDLGDLAGAGVAEWARQWMLWSRRLPYDPGRPGEHSQILNYGGSAGHSGVLAVQLHEDAAKPGGTGPVWEVAVCPFQEAQERDAEAKRGPRAGKADAKRQEAAQRVLAALQALGGTSRTGIRRRELQKATRMKGTTLGHALALLEKEGKVRIEQLPGGRFKTHVVYLTGELGPDRSAIGSDGSVERQ